MTVPVLHVHFPQNQKRHEKTIVLEPLGRDLVDLCGGDFQLDVDELRPENVKN